jgi:hypothetical protein
VLREPRVEHAEQAPHLTLVAVDRKRDLLRQVAEEHVGLAHHRADARHLEHQPLDHERAPLRVRGHQPPGLLGKVNEDRTGLEHREVAGLAVHDRRDAPVRADRQELGALLLERGEVHHVHGVGQPEFLERDGDLVAVRGRGGV